MCVAVNSQTVSTQQYLIWVSVVEQDFAPVMQTSFLHVITRACVPLHIKGNTVKNLTVVIQGGTPVRMVQHVKTLQMALMTVLTVPVYLDMMESSVVRILMNVHLIHAKMVDFV